MKGTVCIMKVIEQMKRVPQISNSMYVYYKSTLPQMSRTILPFKNHLLEDCYVFLHPDGIRFHSKEHSGAHMRYRRKLGEYSQL